MSCLEGWTRMDGKNKGTMVQMDPDSLTSLGFTPHPFGSGAWVAAPPSPERCCPRKGFAFSVPARTPKNSHSGWHGKAENPTLGMFSSQGIPQPQSRSASTAGSALAAILGWKAL